MRAREIFSSSDACPRASATGALGAMAALGRTINLPAFVANLEDCDLLEAEIEGDGYCLPAGVLGDRHLIVIPKSGQGEQRRRFTIAHELGHLAWRFGGGRGTSVEEERWCDLFAAEFLMPRAREEDFARRATVLGDWLRFPYLFNVSKPAAAIQLWEYCGVVLATERIDLKAKSDRYREVRRDLVAAARAVAGPGDSVVHLPCGAEGLVRRAAAGNFVAVAPADGRRATPSTFARVA